VEPGLYPTDLGCLSERLRRFGWHPLQSRWAALQFTGAPPAPTRGIGGGRGPPARPPSPARTCRKGPSPRGSALCCAACPN